jgi:fumarylpyruvate hydrolase
MVWAIPELIVEVSAYIKLEEGDLIFTGTPAGVGSVIPGDILEATLEGFPESLRIKVVK